MSTASKLGEVDRSSRFTGPNLHDSGAKFNQEAHSLSDFPLALIVFTLGNSSDAFLLVRAGELSVATPLFRHLICVNARWPLKEQVASAVTAEGSNAQPGMCGFAHRSAVVGT